jgi:hypothetical protein
LAGLRTRATEPAAVARAARPRAAPAAQRPEPQPSSDLAIAAAAAGADIRSGPDFMEISFPPPAGVPAAAVARTPAAAAAPQPAPAQHAFALDRMPAGSPRSLGGPAGGGALARAARGSSGSSSSSAGLVDAVLRALREENEHLGILDGIDPLF